MRLPLNLGSDAWRRGTRAALVLLTAQALVLAAEDKEKERDKDKGKKHEAVREEPKREAPRAPRPDAKREAAPAPRSEARPESGPGPRRESPREGHPQPHAPAVEPAPRGPGSSPRPAPVLPPGPVIAGHGDAGPRRLPERQVVRTAGGGEIHRSPTGAIREVHTPSGAVIRHSPSGVRQIEIVRPGGRVIVANATGHTGYVQRPLVFHGQSYVQRTFIIDGRPHAELYRPWSHGGREYQVYMPHHYYHPSFYVWAYNPWPRPVYYSWGWRSRPWYGYYGGYFTPYPVYAGPAFWMTDFLIATALESAYLAQNASVSAPPVTYTPATAMTPEVKEAIAEEVRRQMEQAKADQATFQNGGQGSAPPPLFTRNGPRVFLVSNGLLAYAGNQECPLVEGDVLQLAETPALGAEWAEIKVLASRGSSCQKGSFISVRTMDLQEMQNRLQASMEQGMTKLQADQGRDGIPALPPSAQGTVNASYTNDLQPDPSAQSDLALAVKEANSSEQAIINERGPAPAGMGSGGTIALGMSPADVEQILGPPRNTVDLGAKRIYVYKDLKITFLRDRVSDVQ
jgi:hypothetical protein